MEAEPETHFSKPLKNSKKPKKLWAKRSYQTANLLVSLGYFFGTIPVYWNQKEHKMELVKSRFDKYRWKLTITITSFIYLAMGLALVRDLMLSDDPLKFLSQKFMRSGTVIFGGIVILFNMHTAWKYKEFVSFINKGAEFYESFQSKPS